MKILLDMNIPIEWVGVFAHAGFDATHWSEIGEQSAEDSTILSYAAANGYVIFTRDLDFGILLAATRSELPSVVRLKADQASPVIIGELIISLFKQNETRLGDGVFISIDSSKTRVKRLPLGNPRIV